MLRKAIHRASSRAAFTHSRYIYTTVGAAEAAPPRIQGQEVPVPRASSAAWDFTPREACLAGTRGVLRLAGPDLVHFLQGLITNDASKLLEPDAKAMYASVLNAQGRFLYDMFLFKQSGDGEEPVVMADVDAHSLPDIMKLLRRYKLRAAVDIADVSEEQQVWTAFGAQLQLPGRSSERSAEWVVDPRLPELGHRAVIAGSAPSSEAAHVIYGRQYRSWRIEHGVAEGNIEMPAGEAIPLEYNMDGLNAISFTKGCYVGQELVARTHFRGMVRKRIMPIVLVPHAGMDIGHAIEATYSTTKRPVGILRVLNQGSGRGLALLRLQEGLALARGEKALRMRDRPSVSCASWRPAWWPMAWGTEE